MKREYKFGWIYVITNLVNSKKYVGQTVRELRARWAGHLQAARRGGDSALCRAIRKYGEENFIIEPICNCDIDQLCKLEVSYIAAWNTATSGNGYNLTIGGDGVNPTEEIRAKMSVSAKRRAATPEGRANLAACTRAALDPNVRSRLEAKRNKTVSTPEFHDKMSAAIRAVFAQRPCLKRRLSKMQRLYAATDEGRANLSKQALSQWSDPEKRAKLVAARKTQCTEEVRDKLRESSKRRWAKKSEHVKLSKTQKKRYKVAAIRAAVADKQRAYFATHPEIMMKRVEAMRRANLGPTKFTVTARSRV